MDDTMRKNNTIVTRGEFMKMALFSGAFASGALRPFRAAAGLLSQGKSELSVGILTDVHIKFRRKGGKDSLGGVDVLRRALTYFRDAGVDGVVICGDIADSGLREELNAVGDCWFSVFPDNKAPDGRHVEKLFVCGNHDWEGYNYGGYGKRMFGENYYEHAIRKDPAGAWREAFREEYSPVWRKEVKGYTFVGAHWEATHYRKKKNMEAHKAVPWFKANGSSIDPSKPFFYLQHPPPKGTCHCDWVWGCDTGEITAELSRFPNAIALSGHSHASINDERAIWQGAFTSIGCGSLYYTGLMYGDVTPFGRENDIPSSSLNGEDPYKIMRRMPTGDGRQGMIARVFRDRIVYFRMDFESMLPLDDDWVVPLNPEKPMPFSYASRAAGSVAPEFPAGAALSVRMTRGKNRGSKNVKQEEQDVLEIKIPAVAQSGKARAFDYSVSITGSNGMRDDRFVFAEGFYRAASSNRAKSSTVCRLAVRRLKATGDLRIEVHPRNSFGKEGAPLFAKCNSLNGQKNG